MQVNANLGSVYQSVIFKSRYARWHAEEGRRENWDETIDRYFDFFEKHLKKQTNYNLTSELRKELSEAIFNLQVLPSMRCLMTAGSALERDNVAGYNCSFVAIDHPHTFDEIMYVLMCGTGVGFTVERNSVDKLPTINDTFHETPTTIVVPDSRLGWASSYRELINLLYSGRIPKWDLSRIRPAGAKLKTFGGRASGPAPLDDLFRFTVATFKEAAGRKLTSLECHDLVCKVAEIVVVGGVRRSALISLSNLTDDRLRRAKSGQWWEKNAQRALANNSAVYSCRPDMGSFLNEWTSLYESKSGERGIFNRKASQLQAAKSGRRDTNWEFGTNPCSEIILRSKQFCNLSEIVVRPEDTLETLKAKARLATILGTFQSTLTNFRYLSKEWIKNTEAERLLGVSLTGIMDHPVMAGKAGLDTLKEWLTELREHVVATNKEWAELLGIPQSTADTCVKPSGTVSQLVDSASGIHSRYAPFYIRTIRADVKDPLAQFMVAAGFPYEVDVMNKHNLVFSFPIEAPKDSVFRDDRTAIEELELWKIYQDFWCEHKPSVTIYVREHEWMEVGAWTFKNFDTMSGVSFLPHTEHNYKQAPYTEITKEYYDEFCKLMPADIDWTALSNFEKDDMTTATHELNCSAGMCEII